jgi:putative hydrolase of the HAD superfamily
MIKVICFDLDGVYFLNGKSNFIKALQNLGVSESEAKRVFLQSDQMNKQYKIGALSDEEFWSWALKEWKLDLSIKEITDLLIKGYETNGFVVEYVKKAKLAGYKPAICSSNFPARIDGLQKRFGFLNDFDVVALSYQIGVNKPDKKLYEALISKSGVSPTEIYYSDDYEPAIQAAKDLGIKTDLYTTFDDFINKLQSLGVKL